MLVDRRNLLVSLASLPVLSVFPIGSLSADNVDVASHFFDASRIITGSEILSAVTAKRIESLLRGNDTNFDTRLEALAQGLSGDGTRDDKMSRLNDDNLSFALSIAKPWYLGYLGTPSGRILKDNAEFATFLEAQAYTKIADIVPLLTYPPANAGWWQQVPDGVDASDLAKDAKSWAYQPRQSYTIEPPDPAWRAYAEGKYPTIEAAKAAHASSGDAGKTGRN